MTIDTLARRRLALLAQREDIDAVGAVGRALDGGAE